MSDRQRVLIGRSMASVAIMSALVGLLWLVGLGVTEPLWGDWLIHNGIVAVGSGAIAWFVVGSQPRNAVIWVFAWAGLSTGLACLFFGLAAFLALRYGVRPDLMSIVPADVPTPLALVAMNVNWLWMPLLLPFTVGLLLFPDGKPPSSRWRPVLWVTIAIILLTSFGLAWEARPSGIYALSETQDTHGGFRSLTASLVTIGYPASFVMVLVSVAALVTRFRRSVGVERQQFRWVVWGSVVAGILMSGAILSDEVVGRLDIALGLGALGMTVLLGSFGVAITKYRLYDIDVVISRTFVYGSLALFISVLYISIVVGVGSVFGSGEETNQALAIAATAVVAIAFQPMRRAMNRVANRIVYGRRSSHYEVLSDFSRQVAAADESLNLEVARSLVDGTAAVGAAVWVNVDGDLHLAAEWPEGSAPEESSDATTWADVSQDGEELGRVSLTLPPGQTVEPGDQRLLDQMASGMGLALRNLRLTEDLRARVDDLRESRRRIVSVQDETRRQLERDLHDGAQQHLVALKVKMGLARQLTGGENAPRTTDFLERLSSEADEAIQSMRDFARGIYPPLLEAEGLSAAISAQARKFPIPVSVKADDLGRYGTEVESTVYFCVLESLQNVAKHARATRAEVTITDDGPAVSFRVVDDGVGFDSHSDGSGLVNLADRVDSVGGALKVESSPGSGTTVTGMIPTAVEVLS